MCVNQVLNCLVTYVARYWTQNWILIGVITNLAMRFNEKEIVPVASQTADKEGRLCYKSPGFRETYKERWFKLKGNLLFYFRLNEYGAVYEKEPAGVLVIEQCRIQEEKYCELPFTFSITFAGDMERRHYFGCQTQRHCDEWIAILKESSYEYQREKLKDLQTKILIKTGKDPLATFSTRKGESTIEETDSDVYFTRIHQVKVPKANSVPGDLPFL